MTEQEAVKMLLDKADGDPHHALALAVRWVGAVGLCTSAGFLRVAPYDHIKEPKQKPEPLDA